MRGAPRTSTAAGNELMAAPDGAMEGHRASGTSASLDTIWTLELTEIAQLIQQRHVTSEQVTESTLRRIERLDPELKSYVFVMADSALKAARAADAEIARGHYRGVLHGVPIGVKDICYTVDAPTAAGTTFRVGSPPRYDATVVARLRAAGAIVTGKLAMTEGAYLAYHPSHPQPVNPWNPDTWPGVSSSGCAVATAAGLCFGSVGSDTGGSIRFPASMCGLTGIKPTWGRVSRYGIIDLAPSFDHVGPIARTARDAGALLAVMAGADAKDPASSTSTVPDYADDLALNQRPRVGVDWSLMESFDDETRSMMSNVVATVSDIGWPVAAVRLPALGPIVEACAKMRAVETAAAHARTYPAFAADYGPALREHIDAGLHMDSTTYQALVTQRRVFTDAIRRLFQSVDLILMPSSGLASPTLEAMRMLGNDPELAAALAAPTVPFNMSGHPAICLPAGTAARGTPLGVQFVGAEFAERLLVRAGHAFQGATQFHLLRPTL